MRKEKYDSDSSYIHRNIWFVCNVLLFVRGWKMIFEKGEFGIFPAKLIKGLSPNLQVVLSWLIFHTNSKTGVSFPSHETLCRECGIKSRSTIIQALNDLERLGYIRKRKRFKESGGYTSNEYEVFVKQRRGSSDNEQGYVQNVDTNQKNNNQKNINIELFNICWSLYEHKGNKQTALRYWEKLNDDDRKTIHQNIPTYIKSREKQYRKDFQGWINPTNRMWEDEIIVKEKERIKI